MNIAVYATGHGFGHLTRTLAVMGELSRLYPNVRIHLRAPFPEAQVFDALEAPIESFSPVRLDIGLVQIDSLHHDKAASLKELRHYFGPDGDRLVEEEAEWLKRECIDSALVDIPPRAFDACRLADVPAFASTNFSWDDIWRDLAAEDPEFARYADHASASYATAKRLFRTSMAIGLSAFPVVEDVPLIARISHLDPAEVRRRLGLEPEDRPVVLFAFGGEGLNGITPPSSEVLKRFSFVATQPMKDPKGGVHFVSDAELRSKDLRYYDLVHAADIVMSKPGFSTVAECVANRAALVMSNRNHFLEARAITAYVKDSLPSELIAMETLLDGSWEEALGRLAGRMPFEFPVIACNGAEVVARRLVEETA